MIFQTMFASRTRTELDDEIKRHRLAIESAKSERRNVAVLEEGENSEHVLPILLSLCKEEKYRSAQDLHDQIDKLETELERVQSIQERIPIVKQIAELEQLLAQNHGTVAGDEIAHTNRVSGPLLRESKKRSASAMGQAETVAIGREVHGAFNDEAVAAKIAKLEDRVVELIDTVQEQNRMIHELKNKIDDGRYMG